jgi:hypothetical protein
VYINKKSAFTLIELIVVVMMIWILMMATTMYLWWSDEKRKAIEAQWCANSIWWEINNFLFYTLTSKNLKLSENVFIFPNYYIVEFTWWNGSFCSSGDMCDKINLSYSTWDSPSDIKIYKTLSISDTCNQNNQLKFYWSWADEKYIIMNKWFSPKNINDKNVFYVSGNNSIALTWDVIVGLCLNKDCDKPKEIWKFVADARSQTISFRNCKFYDNDDQTKCKTREGCQIYDSSDSTICQRY